MLQILQMRGKVRACDLVLDIKKAYKPSPLYERLKQIENEEYGTPKDEKFSHFFFK